MQRPSEPKRYMSASMGPSHRSDWNVLPKSVRTIGASVLARAPRCGAGRQTVDERKRASATSTTYTRTPRSGRLSQGVFQSSRLKPSGWLAGGQFGQTRACGEGSIADVPRELLVVTTVVPTVQHIAPEATSVRTVSLTT
ncbi:hypothetical protein V7S43_009556 [Phytophthora oleae]|uniref:Uncharacterized protein n=1 Tax=Phytophthora oleae TaxID=2107226 RepID=A0ABD3FGX1_9STRA